MNRLANEIGDRSLGVLLYASARGRQFSYERAEWGNGAFTRAMLDGLAGKADREKLGYVDTEELSVLRAPPSDGHDQGPAGAGARQARRRARNEDRPSEIESDDAARSIRRTASSPISARNTPRPPRRAPAGSPPAGASARPNTSGWGRPERLPEQTAPAAMPSRLQAPWGAPLRVTSFPKPSVA